MFQVDYPEIVDGIMPRHRFMAAYEQKMEPPDRKWQYLLFAAEPYETIAFKVGTGQWLSLSVSSHDLAQTQNYNFDYFIRFYCHCTNIFSACETWNISCL